MIRVILGFSRVAEHKPRFPLSKNADRQEPLYSLLVPIFVWRPLLTVRAHRFSPLVIACWAQTTRFEGIPKKATLTRPSIFRPWFPGAPRASDLRSLAPNKTLQQCTTVFARVTLAVWIQGSLECTYQ